MAGASYCKGHAEPYVQWRMRGHGTCSPQPVSDVIPIHPVPAAGEAPQRIVKVRRDYNSWVARETMEDYALRYTPQRSRKWSSFRVANTAFGAASFLILE